VIHDELHPEELLTRAATRPLNAEETADLRAHVERCPACALQLGLRGDLKRALAPTDEDAERGARAVQRLVAAGAPAKVTRASRGGARVAARMALIGLMLVGTGVGAAVLLQRAREGRLWSGAASVTPAEPERIGANRAKSRAKDVAVVSEPPVADQLATAPVNHPLPAPEEEPARAAPPAAPPSDLALALSRAKEPVVPESVRRPSVRPAAPEAPELPAEAERAHEPTREAEPPAPSETAAWVFQAAERARRRGDATEADRLYGQLASDFPRSREEIAARALHGQLSLDELGRAEEALAWFDAYLRAAPRGALAEEARAGRAEAFGRLARREDEAAAWRDLLAAHPASLFTARAQQRLAALARE
jgi:tetratricopeptide (TPR) repeat protein